MIACTQNIIAIYLTNPRSCRLRLQFQVPLPPFLLQQMQRSKVREGLRASIWLHACLPTGYLVPARLIRTTRTPAGEVLLDRRDACTAMMAEATLAECVDVPSEPVTVAIVAS